MPLHLRPSAELATDALLPGDPGRALLLAQELLAEPKMSNHHRGLWGYTGETAEGRPLTIQSTGMGAPSAAIVIQELAGLGVDRAIRVGTCDAIDPALRPGEMLRVEGAMAEDGVSAALGADGVVRPDRRLLDALAAVGGGSPAIVATTDLFYRETGEEDRWRRAGARAVEMESAALFALGRRLGVAVACVLVVSDVFPGGRRRRIEDGELNRAAVRMGRAAASAFSA